MRDEGGSAIAAGSPWSAACLNCGAPLEGPYCSRCGQRALPPHPTTRELVGDSYAALVGWDGKLVATIRLLLFSPGELTRVLLAGQRKKYVSPVRLYLACSLVYFAVAAAAPMPPVTAGARVGTGSAAVVPPSPGDAALAKATAVGLAALAPDERVAAEARIEALPGVLRPLVRAMAVDYPSLKRRISETMPRALFVLIPALAAILGLFYRGRPYPDHLYFAVHFQAFVFLGLTLQAAMLYAGSLTLLGTAQVVIGVWIVVYAVIAQRRVYGRSWLATGLRALGIAVLYWALWSAISVGVAVWTAS